MRKLAALAAAIAFAGGVQVAAAADISYKDTPYEAPLAPIWSGFYVGGHVGGLWNDGGDSSSEKSSRNKYLHCPKPWKWWACSWKYTEWTEWKETDKVKFDDSDDDTTLIGGIHMGYNFQDGAKVYGIEGDVSFGDGIDYLASLRARLGYAMDNFLIYATAGVAFASFDDKALTADIYGYEHSLDFSGEKKVGFVVGGGAEYKLASNLSLGVEGLYYFFGDSSDTVEIDGHLKKYKLTHEDDNDMFVVRARMSYHLQDAYEEPLK